MINSLIISIGIFTSLNWIKYLLLWYVALTNNTVTENNHHMASKELTYRTVQVVLVWYVLALRYMV